MPCNNCKDESLNINPTNIMDSPQSETNHQGWMRDRNWVVSGISGRFPEADSVRELTDKLFAGVDMMTIDDRKWPPGNFYEYTMPP